MNDVDSLASSDDSSDDEFLTMKDGVSGTSQDREALIRKKLMESFYGKSLPADNDDDDDDDDDDDMSSDDDGDDKRKGAGSESKGPHQHAPLEPAMANDDLDSPYFDPEAMTSKLILHSNIKSVLETEEDLALQVRTLDSTMQTLVYENYSKFIDATDAIRSIGVNVHANEEGLTKLGKGILNIDEKSREVEEALGGLRDQVAEKLRIKRLLTRLDALLKLPTTLESQINSGQYRLATRSYLSAYAILSKHSEGFESLKTIEVDCHGILEEMIKSLKRKLVFWSGETPGYRPKLDSDYGVDDFGVDNETEDQPEIQEADTEEWEDPPEPPNTISEIFECAGTLYLVLPKAKHGDDDGDDATDKEQTDDRTTFDAGLALSEIKSLALAATMRFLDRILDSHHVELQDAMFPSSGFDENPFNGQMSAIAPTTSEEDAPPGANLIPKTFLDNVLEAATLFGLSFNTDLSDSDRLMVMDYVTESFASFLSHVRSVLLDRNVQPSSFDDEAKNGDDLDDDDGDSAYNEISGAMTHLLRLVKQLASGLALPEVGVDAEFASGMVEQAVEVMESMVRRRVAQKFFSLRLRVAQECLLPFARKAIGEEDEEKIEKDDEGEVKSEALNIIQLVEMSHVALSDGLQMVDDTIRSILTGGVIVSDLKGVDFEMVKEAVQESCRRFAVWLAKAIEVMAGCQSSDTKLTIDAEPKNGSEETVEQEAKAEDDFNEPIAQTDVLSLDEDVIVDKIEEALSELIEKIEVGTSTATCPHLTLALSEMCREAEKTVMANANQSIASSVGVSRKLQRTSSIFQSSGSADLNRLGDADENASSRFRLAASRIVSLYAIDRGSEAGALLCNEFYQMARMDGEELPEKPRDVTWQSLEFAKAVCLDCSNIYGGESRAGPIPEPPDEDDLLVSGGMAALGRSALLSGSIKGLQLDVERMFTEKVPAFPHPSRPVEFSRNSVVSIVLNVAFSALVEQTRTCTFSTKGYQQLQVDVAFLRHLLPHYVIDDMVGEGLHALTILDNVLANALSIAGDRCKDPDCVGQESFYDSVTGESASVQSILRAFLLKLASDAASREEDTTEGTASSASVLDRFEIKLTANEGGQS